LERKAPPTFDVVVEIQSWERVAIHPDVATTVDTMLRGRIAPIEVRWFDENGKVRREREAPATSSLQMVSSDRRTPTGTKRAFPFGIDRIRLEKIAKKMQLPLSPVPDLNQADLLLTSKSEYRKKPQVLVAAEAAGIPIYVLKSKATPQIEQGLAHIFSEEEASSIATALKEAEEAITKVKGEGQAAELSPQNAFIRRLQHQLAERHDLLSQSTGKEPKRRVRVFKGEP
jgi:hypothetical protein